jgi:hypothetical protein
MKKRYVLGLLAVFIVFATIGSQCQKVTEPASVARSAYPHPEYAPPFSASDFSSEQTCQAACNEYYTGMLTDENRRHSEVMKGLSGNSSEVKEMRREEISRHKETVREIQEARQQCVRDCHDQGGASGGF